MIWTLLLACKTEPKESGSADSLAYYGTIDALIADNCARCHTAGGQARSFDKPEDVQAMAASMWSEVEAGRMPPPAPDPACRDYTGSERFVLDEDEKALLKAWVDAGAPLGDPARASEGGGAMATLAPFDRELVAPSAYQPHFGDGENDYRCFRIDLNNEVPVFLTGMEALVDNDAIVHHVVIFNAGSTSPSEDPTGFSCSGFGESGWDYLAGWAPGSQPLEFPAGMGMELAANTELVLQMHYFNSFEGADQELDQSGYGLKLADAVDVPVYVLSLGTYQFTVPANEADFVTEDVTRWRQGSGQVLGVWPHMHLLGTGFDMGLVRGDGSEECLVHMDGWDFHNQVSSLYVEPVALGAGDEISYSCSYDNSSGNLNNPNNPPQDVEWGEGTTQEMCFGFTYVAIP